MAESFHPLRRRSSEPSYFYKRNNTSLSQVSNMDYQPGAFSLPLNVGMAIPIYTAPSRQDVEFGGRLLLHNFIHEQFVHEDLSEEVLAEIENPSPDEYGDVGPVFNHQAAGVSSLATSTPEGYTPNNMIVIGRNLRALANQFAESKERPLIKEQADQVDLGQINRDDFFNMLNIIFRDGLDRHGLIALFFFCSDVLIRCVRQELRHIGTRLLFWAMQFLVDKVCAWVYSQGGWEKVLSTIYDVLFKVSAILALGVVISCGFIWMRKNW